jgi:P-type Cu+ transporter
MVGELSGGDPVAGLPEQTEGRSAIDPVCGMTVDPSTASDSFNYKGREFYFCSQNCLDRFKSNPEQHVGKTSIAQIGGSKACGESSVKEGQYTCPMHPDMQLDSPGCCASCGKAMKPLQPAVTAKTQYTCPMHPEIVREPARDVSYLRDGARADRDQGG